VKGHEVNEGLLNIQTIHPPVFSQADIIVLYPIISAMYSHYLYSKGCNASKAPWVPLCCVSHYEDAARSNSNSCIGFL